MDLKKFCEAIPKIELHAHLNTSFSRRTLDKLVKRKMDDNPDFRHNKLMFDVQEKCDLDDHFEIFRQLHTVCNDAHAIYTLMYDIIHEFAADNVKYVEIRSTPKTIKETGLTPDIYMEQMVRAVRDCEKEGVDIIVRILPSIDRRNGVDIAYSTVELAQRWSQKTDGLVCGVDLSGDPAVGNAADYIPVLNSAAGKGLKAAVHLAELPNFRETLDVLEGTTVNRIGHGTFLHKHEGNFSNIEKIVLEKKIPIEVCMTSNVKSRTVKDYPSHHLELWYNRSHPIVICTDGKGVYQSTLSDEYRNAAAAFQMSRQKIWDLSLQSIEHIFAGEDVKQCLREKWRGMKPSLGL